MNLKESVYIQDDYFKISNEKTDKVEDYIDNLLYSIESSKFNIFNIFLDKKNLRNICDNNKKIKLMKDYLEEKKISYLNLPKIQNQDIKFKSSYQKFSNSKKNTNYKVTKNSENYGDSHKIYNDFEISKKKEKKNSSLIYAKKSNNIVSSRYLPFLNVIESNIFLNYKSKNKFKIRKK